MFVLCANDADLCLVLFQGTIVFSEWEKFINSVRGIHLNLIADSRKKQTKLKKKARSFKDEIRDKFSNMKGVGTRSPSPQKMSPVKSPKKKGIGRHSSFNEGSHVDKSGKETVSYSSFIIFYTEILSSQDRMSKSRTLF